MPPNLCGECGALAPAGWDLCLHCAEAERLLEAAPAWRLPPDDALRERLLDGQPLCPDCRLPYDEKARQQFARLALDPERQSTWWNCQGCGRGVCGRLMGIAYRLT